MTEDTQDLQESDVEQPRVPVPELPPAAQRVCVVKATGKLLEYQSSCRPGTLQLNAVAAGYALEDVEEREVTDAEWAQLREQHIDAPARQQRAERDETKRTAADRVKKKLGLSDAELADLREALT